MTLRPLAVGEESPPMLTAEEKDRNASKPSKAKGKAKERFALLNAFVDFTMGELSRADIVVWLILYRDSKEGVAGTTQTDIGRRGKINALNVLRDLQRRAELVRSGAMNQAECTAADSSRLPLSEHLDAYKDHLESREVGEGHLTATLRNLRRVAAECAFSALADFTREPLRPTHVGNGGQ